MLHTVNRKITMKSVASVIQSWPSFWASMNWSTPDSLMGNTQFLLKIISMESMMPSNHLIFCRHLLLLPSIFSSIRVFSNESVICIRWPKYWSFSFSISPSNEHSGLISWRWTGLISSSSRDCQESSSTTVQKLQFFSARLSLLSNSHIHT